MSTNKPDKWVIIKLLGKDETTPLYKVFATWYGGYLGGDTWKLNSGIRSVEDNGDSYTFHGYSGSEYVCGKGEAHYGTSSYTGSVLESMIDNVTDHTHNIIEILKHSDNWVELKY
tara:strand:+ start:2388 stop:2732 length:345 start_codon:yes stop_codon:yes gene_type:complete